MSTTDDTLIFLTLNEALQLVVIAPCLMLVAYLLICKRKSTSVAVPVLYFLVLGFGASYYAFPRLLSEMLPASVEIAFLGAESMIAGVSFLLIIQLIQNRPPPVQFWVIVLSVLASQLPFIYAAVEYPLLCLSANRCIDANTLYQLNHIIFSGALFLLLVVYVSRFLREVKRNKLGRAKYWLIILMIGFNLLLLVTQLLLVQESILLSEYVLVRTSIKLGFIYTAIVSLFRLYMENSLTEQKDAELTAYEQSVAKRLEKFFDEQKPYRDLEFGRASLADSLNVKEHVLSRIIKLHFQMSFSELSNGYRIADAKAMLTETNDPITSISFDSGFSSVTSFNRVFKDATALSPSAFRQEALKDDKKQATSRDDDLPKPGNGVKSESDGINSSRVAPPQVLKKSMVNT